MLYNRIYISEIKATFPSSYSQLTCLIMNLNLQYRKFNAQYIDESISNFNFALRNQDIMVTY